MMVEEKQRGRAKRGLPVDEGVDGDGRWGMRREWNLPTLREGEA